MQVAPFNTNEFKRSVKNWMSHSPSATVEELIDYCEELIPTHEYQSYSWLVEQTTQWYKHVLKQREIAERYEDDEHID